MTDDRLTKLVAEANEKWDLQAHGENYLLALFCALRLAMGVSFPDATRAVLTEYRKHGGKIIFNRFTEVVLKDQNQEAIEGEKIFKVNAQLLLGLISTAEQKIGNNRPKSPLMNLVTLESVFRMDSDFSNWAATFKETSRILIDRRKEVER